jgi:predicted transcriptional regulator
MAKRNKLEIIRDILNVVKDHNNSIKFTPLLRKSNMSTNRFKDYFNEIREKGFVNELINSRNEKFISLTDKGSKFLEKYRAIIEFIEEFEL